jgi:hypothetical protein
MAGAPIEPQDYIYGVKVVDIGDARVKRGKSRRPIGTCLHKHMHYDDAERRIWCADCESDIDGFDAFVVLVNNFHRQAQRNKAREEKIEEAEQATLISRAARKIDMEWRKRTTVPLCPHCVKPLLPEDIVKHLPTMSRALIMRKLNKTGD